MCPFIWRGGRGPACPACASTAGTGVFFRAPSHGRLHPDMGVRLLFFIVWAQRSLPTRKIRRFSCSPLHSPLSREASCKGKFVLNLERGWGPAPSHGREVGDGPGGLPACTQLWAPAPSYGRLHPVFSSVLPAPLTPQVQVCSSGHRAMGACTQLWAPAAMGVRWAGLFVFSSFRGTNTPFSTLQYISSLVSCVVNVFFSSLLIISFVSLRVLRG